MTTSPNINALSPRVRNAVLRAVGGKGPDVLGWSGAGKELGQLTDEDLLAIRSFGGLALEEWRAIFPLDVAATEAGHMSRIEALKHQLKEQRQKNKEQAQTLANQESRLKQLAAFASFADLLEEYDILRKTTCVVGTTSERETISLSLHRSGTDKTHPWEVYLPSKVPQFWSASLARQFGGGLISVAAAAERIEEREAMIGPIVLVRITIAGT